MRRMLIGLVLALIAAPAAAQPRDSITTQCTAGAPDARIVGCSAIIESGLTHSLDLAVAYNNRGNAYDEKGLYDQAIDDFTQSIDPQRAKLRHLFQPRQRVR